MFKNENNFDLGTKQSGVQLHDVQLPLWAHDDPYVSTFALNIELFQFIHLIALGICETASTSSRVRLCVRTS
jgi:hypothetical protein